MSVYFALAPKGLVKIGWSENPARRLLTLRTETRARLKLMAVVTGDKHTERKYHMRFGAYYSHGEWFYYKGKLRKFVESKRMPEQPRCLGSSPPGMSAEYIRLMAARLQKKHGWTEEVARARIIKDGPPGRHKKRKN